MKPAAVAALVAIIVAGALLWIRGGSAPQSATEYPVETAAMQESGASHTPASAPTAPVSAPLANAASPVTTAPATRAPGERAPISEAERSFEEGQFDRGERHVYDDVATTLGLSADENEDLLSVLREQHMLLYELIRSGRGADAEAIRTWEQGRRDAVESLLGPAHGHGFTDYESTIGGRYMVLDAVATLERAGIPMSSEQRISMTKAVIERHAYPPPLRFAGNSMGANMQTQTAQIFLAGQKVLDIAQGILTPRQYDVYQEWVATSLQAQEAANDSAVESHQPEKR